MSLKSWTRVRCQSYVVDELDEEARNKLRMEVKLKTNVYFTCV